MGEIQVRGPFITGSYHRVPVAPDKFTADGWLRTGDVAALDEEGFMRITDRTKDAIKSGGGEQAIGELMRIVRKLSR